MNKFDVVKKILPSSYKPQKAEGKAFAPSNIALCKYWGKRDEQINLPETSSLSISLGDRGSHCIIKPSEKNNFDLVTVNGNALPKEHEFTQKLAAYLDLFRPDSNDFYEITFEFNIPIAAGVASSACSFAALVLALNNLYQWNIKPELLSILGRLGSGSACRSFWPGFVKWKAGQREDGMDSHGVSIPVNWPEFRVGLCIVTHEKKPISSREAMKKTIATAPFYKAWPQKVALDLKNIETAIKEKDFERLGLASESNAISMHALMANAMPPIVYTLPETFNLMHQVWQLRKQNIPVFFTQDAGANLKLFFLKSEQEKLQKSFPEMEIIIPFT